MALTADQLNTIYQNVLFRNVDTAGIQFFANRTDISDAQVRQQIELSQEASSFVSPVVRLYQEVLGRVPDAAGLRFFSNQLRAGTSLDNVAQQLVSSAEFSAKSTAVAGAVDATDLTNTNQLVTDAFQSILGRTPASSEFAFFQGRTPAQILSAIAGSPEAASTNAAGVVTFLDSVAQGTYPTGTLANQTGGAGGGTNAGQLFALTTSPDNLTGTAGNDTFNGVAGTGATFSAADVINGGAGTDTLSIVTDGNFTAFASQLTSVETLRVFATGTTEATITGTGFTTLENNGSQGALTFTGAGTVGALNIANTTQNTTVTYTDAAVTGTSDIVNVGLNNVTGAAQVNINSVTAGGAGVETVALTSNGTVANSITLLSNDATVTRVNIAGSAAATVALGTNFTTVATIDASTDTGGVTISGFGSASQTVTGGQGNDRFLFGANLSTGDVVSGGAGIDTLSANGAQLAGFSISSRPTLSGFETLELANDVGTTATAVDASVFGTINNIRIADQGNADAAAITFNNIAATTNNNFRFDGDLGGTGGTIAFNITDATVGGTANSATIDFRGGATTATSTISLAGVETLTVDTTNATGTQTFGLTDPALTNLTVTGGQSVNIGTLGTAVTNVNASGLTGTAGLTVTLNTSAISGASVTGGNGVDTIVGSQLADTISGGAGADQITGGGGADILTGGAGADNFILATPATDTGTVTGFAASSAIPTSAISTTALDKITDFGTGGADTISLTGVVTGTTVIRNGGTLGGATDGNVALVRGTYDAAGQTFTASATGTSSLFVYDSNGTTAAGDYRGVVLVGYVDATGNDTIATTGGNSTFTFVA